MHSIRIERAQNGFVVSMQDPAIVAKNEKSKGVYLDPEVQFVFDDEADLVAFVTKNLDKIIPPEKKGDFSSSFDVAVEESEAEEKAEGEK